MASWLNIVIILRPVLWLQVHVTFSWTENFCQVGVHYELSEEEKFYRNALTRMPDGPAALEESYNAVEDIVNEVEKYVKVRNA